ncbi:FimV/HubP family polar landmark protein [Rhodoferax sp.]|uniref:FimV/HubP family polar landmark protein n=1 Tax=Rhodoferax sp. TaxID=50421 RepID=UPI002ACEDF8C|nr:FimV/HubP family polar landmark protein [Rhodoferax sp.]MDZ7921668.1 FimV/HubP family polar landmark protein [Rhodoferax sp.]
MAAAAIALLGLSGTGAHALSLGRLTVQSALGEPLRAEIDIPEITAEEAASLKAGVALPDAFVAAGLDYSPAMSSLQATLQRRADGRAYLRLSSERTVNDPFVDLILEATWAQGRIVRDYTLLFDPPALRKAPAAPTLAQVPAAPVVTTLPRSTANAAPSPAAEPARAPTPPARAVAAKPSAPATPPADPNAESLTVKRGDTASKIANSIKPADVSLDQMLVALLRSNPDAFVNDNLNRIRAGAVLSIPKAEQAQSVSPSEASKIVVAQSKDFNDFRRSLASNAPAAAVAAADRKASGSVEAKVEDKKPTSPTPDKLTLSKGSVQGKADEAKIAKEREAQDAAARAAEISKNISDLSKIGSAAAPATGSSAPVAATPAVAVAGLPGPAASAPAAAAASAPAVAPIAEAASAPQATVSAPVKPKIAAPMPVPEEPALLDELLADPLVPAGAAGLIALLGGYAAYRVRQRKKNSAQVDSAFLESRLQPDSFFGASGGQRVDTNQNGPSSASSMVYSASQLDAADDVDPVAEADVYLAYGRDLQAEEILKEAVRTNPGRLAIHTKLLEIFSKRRDTRSFESTATQAYKLTGATSPDWARICEMGLAIDPSNALYQPGGAPASAGVTPAAGNSSFGNSTVPQSAHAELSDAGAPGVDLDLDLDFSLDDEPAASAISDVTGGTMTAAADRTVKMAAQDNSMDMDFDLPVAPLAVATPEPVASMPEISLSLDDLETPMPDEEPQGLKFEATGPAPVVPQPTPTQTADTGLMEFDLGSLSLDLESPADGLTQAPDSAGEDPLETKLALAEEFISIGDEDGARALIEEVVSEASGDMRAKAQRALAKLS